MINFDRWRRPQWRWKVRDCWWGQRWWSHTWEAELAGALRRACVEEASELLASPLGPKAFAARPEWFLKALALAWELVLVWTGSWGLKRVNKANPSNVFIIKFKVLTSLPPPWAPLSLPEGRRSVEGFSRPHRLKHEKSIVIFYKQTPLRTRSGLLILDFAWGWLVIGLAHHGFFTHHGIGCCYIYPRK